MPRTIFFRIGSGDRVSLKAFISALQSFLGILEDLDSAISETARGTMTWEISILQKNSPPVVGVTPVQRHLSRADVSETVESQILENIKSLTLRGERSELMPDAALNKIKKIGSKTKALGPMAVYLNGDGRVKHEELITQQTYKNVSDLTDPKYTAYGSLVGRLESISVHRGNEFRVWDRNTGKPVRCIFSGEHESKVKELLRGTVMVAGMIHSNSAGMPIKLDLDELHPFEETSTLPTIEEISGLIPNFMGGKTLKEYLKDMEDE